MQIELCWKVYTDWYENGRRFVQVQHQRNEESESGLNLKLWIYFKNQYFYYNTTLCCMKLRCYCLKLQHLVENFATFRIFCLHELWKEDTPLLDCCDTEALCWVEMQQTKKMRIADLLWCMEMKRVSIWANNLRLGERVAILFKVFSPPTCFGTFPLGTIYECMSLMKHL